MYHIQSMSPTVFLFIQIIGAELLYDRFYTHTHTQHQDSFVQAIYSLFSPALNLSSTLKTLALSMVRFSNLKKFVRGEGHQILESLSFLWSSATQSCSERRKKIFSVLPLLLGQTERVKIMLGEQLRLNFPNATAPITLESPII